MAQPPPPPPPDPASGGPGAPPPRAAEGAELHPHVGQNIETIAALRAQAEQAVGVHQRGVETATTWLARPRVLYAMLALALGWALANARPGAIDPPPFFWLQGAVGLCALLVSMLVLISQHRQGRLAERHAHLDLQVNLLAEQKAAKVIALLEELRRDLPIVRDRHDAEAELLTQPVDASAVFSALDESLDDAAQAPERPRQGP